MKLRKSTPPYVFVHKNCSRCRAIMLFNSAGTQDHEEVFINLLHHSLSSRKFVRHTISTEVSHKTIHFAWFWLIFWLKSSNNAKSTILWLTSVELVYRKNILELREWFNELMNTFSWYHEENSKVDNLRNIFLDVIEKKAR